LVVPVATGQRTSLLIVGSLAEASACGQTSEGLKKPARSLGKATRFLRRTTRNVNASGLMPRSSALQLVGKEIGKLRLARGE
jgi:hypothetical protein